MSKGTRRSISKKTRFEVFKRDSFTCQYCGKKAPDVVLVIDHIHPVAKGGGSDILNLITSCEPCNQGKSDKTLDDSSAARKRMTQAAELQARREQIEMIAEWQAALTDLDSVALSEVCKFYEKLCPGWELNETGKSEVRGYISKHGITDVMSAFRNAVQCIRVDESGKITDESSTIFTRSALNSLKYLEANRKDPVGSAARYAAGIARNRLNWVPANHRQIFVDWASEGIPLEFLSDLARTATSWNSLYETASRKLDELYGG